MSTFPCQCLTDGTSWAGAERQPEDLGHVCRKVQGTVKWVGTTEAAALLRQFGVRAHVVDFKGLQAASMRTLLHLVYLLDPERPET